MASGFLGKAFPAANTWNNIYSVPAGKVASISVNAANQGGQQTGVDIVISTASSYLTIAQSEYVEYAAPLATASILERTGLVTDATNGKYVWVRSGSGNVSFQVYGYEE
jgi:hypothetical protein